MTLLAVAYLTVQYMLALGETRFLWVLAVVAVAEPVLLSATHLSDHRASPGSCSRSSAWSAASVLALGLRARRRARPPRRHELRRGVGGRVRTSRAG